VAVERITRLSVRGSGSAVNAKAAVERDVADAVDAVAPLENAVSSECLEP
jgi:hypothetical protein